MISAYIDSIKVAKKIYSQTKNFFIKDFDFFQCSGSNRRKT